MRLRASARTFERGSRWSPQDRNQRSEGTGRNTDEPQHTIPIQANDRARTRRRDRPRRTHGGSSDDGTARAPARSHARAQRGGQFALPAGATLVAFAARQFALPPGATLEPTLAGQPALPPGATLEPTVAEPARASARSHPRAHHGADETARRRRSRPLAVRPGSRGPGWVRLDRCGSGGRNRVGRRTAPRWCSSRIQALRATPTASAALRASDQERCGRVYGPPAQS